MHHKRWMLVWVVMFATMVGTVQAAPIADSVADFPTGPTGPKQGVNGWTYGYHNFTGNGAYQVADFIPFPDNQGAGTSPTDFWTGGGWDWHAGNPPWTTIGSTSVHPNGTNHGGPPPANDEQWPIRRYTVQPGDVFGSQSLDVTWTLRKVNPNGSGDLGTTGIVFHNGRAVDQARVRYNDTTGVTRTAIVPGVQVGDVIDIVHTPVGVAGGFPRDDGADGSAMTAVIDLADPLAPFVVADAVNDYSGMQGFADWQYGYYDRTADLGGGGDGAYQPAEFTPFVGGSDIPGGFSATDAWTGTAWDWFNGNPPWTVHTWDIMHPNDGSPGPEHYAVRRWVSEVSGHHVLTGTFRNLSASGDGTIGRVFINGVEQFAGHTDATDADFLIRTSLNAGDVVDFMVDTGPNPGASNADGSDSTRFRATMAHAPVYAAIDTALEFSGTQGLGGWFYGYYNRTADGDGTYQTGDFTLFPGGGDVPGGHSATNFWNGSAWDWFSGNPPWTFIGDATMHPNGANNGDEHWAIRRWVSDVNGMLAMEGFFHNFSGGGDGTTGRILLNGVELAAVLTDGFRTDYQIEAWVGFGDILDIIVDNGPGTSDPFDSTGYGLTMRLIIPEPTTLALVGIGFLAALRRRRR